MVVVVRRFCRGEGCSCGSFYNKYIVVESGGTGVDGLLGTIAIDNDGLDGGTREEGFGVTVLMAKNTKFVKDRAYMRLLGTKCSIMVTSGLCGTSRGTMSEMGRVAKGSLGFCGTSVHSGRTVGRVFRGRRVRSIVRFTKLGTMNRSIIGPLRCCRGGVTKALILYSMVEGRNIGGVVFDSSTAMCNSPTFVPVARRYPGKAYAGPCK